MGVSMHHPWPDAKNTIYSIMEVLVLTFDQTLASTREKNQSQHRLAAIHDSHVNPNPNPELKVKPPQGEQEKVASQSEL